MYILYIFDMKCPMNSAFSLYYVLSLAMMQLVIKLNLRLTAMPSGRFLMFLQKIKMIEH